MGDGDDDRETTMRVAMVDPSLFSPEYDAAICDALGALGHDVTLVARPPRPGEPVRPGRYHLVPHFYRRSERLRDRLPRAFRYAKAVEHQNDVSRLHGVLRTLQPDVVHFQWPVLASVDALVVRRLRRQWPAVLTVHNTTAFHGSPHSRAQNVGMDRFVGAFDALVTHGEGSAAALAESFDAPVHVVPHGLLAGVEGGESPAPRPPSNGSGAGALRLLCFGRVRTYKGIDVLIDALGMLAPGARDRVSLTVAGVPEQPIEPLRDQAARLGVAGRIRWDLRFVPDSEVDPLFDQADAVVLPYREVDASGVLMKAIARGTPTVATRVGAFADLLEGERAGLLVEPGDPRGLATAIARLLDEPGLRSALTSGAVDLRRDHPSWSEIAARTVEVYRTLPRRRAGIHSAAAHPG